MNQRRPTLLVWFSFRFQRVALRLQKFSVGRKHEQPEIRRVLLRQLAQKMRNQQP